MSIFTFWVTLGPGLAPVIFSWVEANPRLEWRWIQWFQMSKSHTTFYASYKWLMTSHFRLVLPHCRPSPPGDESHSPT
jgi:hypothetical protein